MSLKHALKKIIQLSSSGKDQLSIEGHSSFSIERKLWRLLSVIFSPCIKVFYNKSSQKKDKNSSFIT